MFDYVILNSRSYLLIMKKKKKKKTKKSHIIILPTISTSFDKYNSPKPGNPTELHNNLYETIDFAM